MPYVDIAGRSTYFEQHGGGDPVLLLHGGFCSIETWQPQIEHLASSYQVHAPERAGQGRTADVDGPLSYHAMLAETVGYLDAVGLESAHVIGFSDGAIIGLLLAMEQPDRVRSLVAISANLNPQALVEEDPDIDDGGDVDDDSDGFRAAYDRLSPDGPEHGDVVLEKLMRMWLSEPVIDPEELARIAAPTLVLACEHDSIKTEHTVAIARAIPRGQLAIVPDAGHLLPMQQPDVLNAIVDRFLEGVTSGR